MVGDIARSRETWDESTKTGHTDRTDNSLSVLIQWSESPRALGWSSFHVMSCHLSRSASLAGRPTSRLYSNSVLEATLKASFYKVLMTSHWKKLNYSKAIQGRNLVWLTKATKKKLTAYNDMWYEFITKYHTKKSEQNVLLIRHMGSLSSSPWGWSKGVQLQ